MVCGVSDGGRERGREGGRKGGREGSGGRGEEEEDGSGYHSGDATLKPPGCV